MTRLLRTHDLVELHAGDLHFDAPDDQQAAQAAADTARPLSGLLLPNQAHAFHALHAEFETRATPETCFTRALDALHPILFTWAGRGAGRATQAPDLTATRFLPLKEKPPVSDPDLWALAQQGMQNPLKAGTLPR